MEKTIESSTLKHLSRTTIFKLYLAWFVAIFSEVIIQYTLYDQLYNFRDFHILGFSIEKAFYASLGVFSASSVLSYLLINHVRIRFFYRDLPTPKLKRGTKMVIGVILLCFALSGLLNSLLVVSSWDIELNVLTQLIEVIMAILLCAVSLIMVCISGLAGAALLVALPVRKVRRDIEKNSKALIEAQRRFAELSSRDIENERVFQELDHIMKEMVLVDTTKVSKIDFNASQQTPKTKK